MRMMFLGKQIIGGKMENLVYGRGYALFSKPN